MHAHARIMSAAARHCASTIVVVGTYVEVACQLHSVMRCATSTRQLSLIESIVMAQRGWLLNTFSLRNLHCLLHISRAAPTHFTWVLSMACRSIDRSVESSRIRHAFLRAIHHLPSPARLLLGHRFSAKKGDVRSMILATWVLCHVLRFASSIVRCQVSSFSLSTVIHWQ
jgi:hypothetical protein